MKVTEAANLSKTDLVLSLAIGEEDDEEDELTVIIESSRFKNTFCSPLKYFY